MKNEKALLALRPDLSHLSTENASDAEKFQNVTLRPIIKMQHEILMSLVDGTPHFLSIASRSKTVEDYKGKVIDFINQQTALKNQIIGMIIGHFTNDEWTGYALNKSEFNKRIINMCGERMGGAFWVE